MPVHDWTRVDAGIFHDFHTVWLGNIRTAFNSGLLPAEYYALAEHVAGGIGPDVLTLREPVSEGNGSSNGLQGAVAVAKAPPKTRFVTAIEENVEVRKPRAVVIRHVSNHRIVALVEILSPGNKASQYALRTFVEKALTALDQGIHLLLVDLHPPGPRDPSGIHGALWEELTGEPFQLVIEKPLTLAAYSSGPPKTAYVEPIAVGDTLPDMPLFLVPEYYVNVPLEKTYRAAFDGVPRFYRNMLQ